MTYNAIASPENFTPPICFCGRLSRIEFCTWDGVTRSVHVGVACEHPLGFQGEPLREGRYVREMDVVSAVSSGKRCRPFGDLNNPRSAELAKLYGVRMSFWGALFPHERQVRALNPGDVFVLVVTDDATREEWDATAVCLSSDDQFTTGSTFVMRYRVLSSTREDRRMIEYGKIKSDQRLTCLVLCNKTGTRDDPDGWAAKNKLKGR